MTVGSSLNQTCVMSKRDCVIDVNLDLLEVIGSHCDPLTKVQLCLASKDYYQVTRLNDREYQDELIYHFITYTQELTDSVPTIPSKLGRLRRVHKIYRFITSHTYALQLINKDVLVQAFVNKLDEFVRDGMCRRKAKLYKKMLTCNTKS